MARSPDENSTPGQLSHYTTLEGMIGILSTGQVWASNVAYLNDREELKHGLSCAAHVVPKLRKSRAVAHWADLVGTVVDEFQAGDMPNTYAACFCRTPDLLSQWRGYGGREQGVSLTFDYTGLAALREGKKTFLTKVSYGLIAGRAEMYAGLAKRLGLIDAIKFKALSEDDRHAEARSAISNLAPRLKHIGFQAEREWRLIVQQDTLRTETCFRVSGKVVVPYLKIGATDDKLPLKSVMIGPGGEMELTQKSVKSFLDFAGYDVPVRLSRVPFRS